MQGDDSAMADELTAGNGNGVDPAIRAATSEVDVAATSAVDPELRAAFAELKVLESSLILARTAFARAAGFTFDNARDVYGILGYKDLLSTADYRARYQRGGVAGRLVDVYPNACWRGEMELIEDESKETYTEFEQAWHDFDQRLQVKAKFRRVDILAGLSTFSVLLIGHRDGKLDEPLEKAPYKPARAALIAYLRPFAGGGGTININVQTDRTLATGADATIYEYETDVTNERFGLPKTYWLKGVGLDGQQKTVHWSRILHVAEGLLDDDVFGIPTLERVWNDLDNLDKVSGGGSEAFWLRANQGVHVDVDKDMKLDDAKNTIAAIKEQVDNYKHQLDRWIRTRGAKIDVLGSDVANFQGPVDTILSLIAGAKGIPQRILKGSEMGELASSQDRDNWADQINGRQTGYLAPYMVRPLVDRLVAYGYLPTPKKSADAYEVRWPHIQTLTENEKAQGATQWASVNSTMGEPVFTEAEIRDKWYGMPPLTDEQRKEIDDRAQEKMKQQQEAMAAAKPPEDKKVPPQLLKAASAWEPEPGDEELVNVLADALEAGAVDVVAKIVGLSILPMHKLSNGAALCGQRATDAWLIADDEDVTCVACIGLLRSLGDVEGHEFHGNQYTSSTGTSPALEERLRNRRGYISESLRLALVPEGYASPEQKAKLLDAYQTIDRLLKDPDIGAQVFSTISAATPESIVERITALRNDWMKVIKGGHVPISKREPRAASAKDDLSVLAELLRDPGMADLVVRMLQQAKAAGGWRAFTKTLRTAGDVVGHEFHGNQWTSQGGFEHTGITWKQPTNPKTGRPIPIKVDTVEEAAILLYEGKVVEVKDVQTAYTLIDKLGQMANEAKSSGKEAQDFDLCNISVKGTNMFCAESVRNAEYPDGIPRIEMPQLGGKPLPGTEADRLPRNKWYASEVDGAAHFKAYLQGIGMRTEDDVVPVDRLRASQREMKGNTVALMMNDKSFDPATNPVFISNDNYIVDGHHRWAAVVGRDAENGVLGDSKMNVVRVNAQISEVLHLANAWSEKFGIQQTAGVKRQAKHTGLRP
jgi:hypothetical protein